MTPFYLAGPTGTGKSGVALELAARCNGEIVNADAFQIYRGLDVLSAKPTASGMARAPHHLYSVLAPSESCSAARFERLARPCIAEIIARRRLPIVTGGTGLYLKALTHGLSPVPGANAALRGALEAVPHADLVSWLERLDPTGAGAINLANRRYVQRAVEIILQTGQLLSVAKGKWDRCAPEFRGVILLRERDELYARINRRVRSMVEAGLLDEVRALGVLSPTARKAIGIPEVRRHLLGEITLEQCIAEIQQATRRYAKRQGTWFKREKGFQTICLAPDEDANAACARILNLFPGLQPGP